jgi:DNA repair exonuclease SbcCD ATPase subunit
MHAAVSQADSEEQPLGNPIQRFSRDGTASLDSTEFTGAQVMAFLQRLQDSLAENEELRLQLQQLKTELADQQGKYAYGDQESLPFVQELRKEHHELSVKLDIERLRYQNAVDQLKHAEAQGKAKSAEVVHLKEQLANLERLSAKRLEEAVESLVELGALTENFTKASTRALADSSLQQSLTRIDEMAKTIEALSVKVEEGKRRERLMEQRNVSLENRLKAGGVPVVEEPLVRHDTVSQIQQHQQHQQHQQQLMRLQDLIIELQKQQNQQQQHELQYQTQLQDANVALLSARQQHQKDHENFQQQLFAAEDRARASAFATIQVQEYLDQANIRIRSFEAEIQRLEQTVREQQQILQQQQQQQQQQQSARPKAFHSLAVQTIYSSPIVLEDASPPTASLPNAPRDADVSHQVCA